MGPGNFEIRRRSTRSLVLGLALVLFSTNLSFSREDRDSDGFHFQDRSLLTSRDFSTRFTHFEDLPVPTKLFEATKRLTVVYGNDEYGYLESKDFRVGSTSITLRLIPLGYRLPIRFYFRFSDKMGRYEYRFIKTKRYHNPLPAQLNGTRRDVTGSFHFSSLLFTSR
jgi:hypothetical protein